jgi:hypothetical protein
VDVVLVLWPDEAPQLPRLVTAGTPRLLLVAPDASPPEDGDCLQDWIRLPAVHILRLRRRIAPLGLEIHNVPGKGYVLTPRS